MRPWHLHPQWQVWGSMIPCVIDPGRMEVGSGAVLLGHGGGRLENTIPRVLGQRDAVWLAAGEEGAGFLGCVPSAAVRGPSPAAPTSASALDLGSLQEHELASSLF